MELWQSFFANPFFTQYSQIKIKKEKKEKKRKREKREENLMSDLEIREGTIDASACLSEGWALIKPYYGTFLGMIVVMFIISIAIGFIPYIGGVINAILSGPFLCGIYYALVRRTRGEDAQFSMLFEGFSRFLPSFLVTLIYTLPMLLLGVAVYFFITANSVMPEATGAGDISAILGRQFSAGIIASSIAAYLISLVLQILLFFAIPLIAEHNLGIGDAVKLSIAGATGNLGGLIVLFLLEFLVLLISLFALCIGIFFAMPVIYAANIIAYRSVFPAGQASFFNEPPRPDAYGGTYGTPQ